MKSWKYENIWMVFVWIFMVFIHFACYVDLAEVESSEFSIILSVIFMYIPEYTLHLLNRLFKGFTVTMMLVTCCCCWLNTQFSKLRSVMNLVQPKRHKILVQSVNQPIQRTTSLSNPDLPRMKSFIFIHFLLTILHSVLHVSTLHYTV